MAKLCFTFITIDYCDSTNTFMSTRGSDHTDLCSGLVLKKHSRSGETWTMSIENYNLSMCIGHSSATFISPTF